MPLEVKIIEIHAREILDSRGNPTVEVDVIAETETTGKKSRGRASVPSGASTGQFEAIELRDGESRYFGLGVQRVVDHVNTRIRNELLGMNVLDQLAIDRRLVELDGTDNKGNLGANATLGVSLAAARCAAKAMHLPLFRYLGGFDAKELPRPMMNVINGGAHAKNTLDFQEFMIVPVGAHTFADALRMGAEVYHFLKEILQHDGMLTAVGDEGGFAPELKNAFEVFDYLYKAVERAGYRPGEDIAFAMDAAASELYQADAGMYYFPGESRMCNQIASEIAQNCKCDGTGEVTDCGCDGTNDNADCSCEDVVRTIACGCEGQSESTNCECSETGTEARIRRPDTEGCAVFRSSSEMIALYEELVNRYPIISIEDGLDENDWDGWQEMTRRLGDQIMLVGDDLFVTNVKRIRAGISLGAGNAVLIKANQIGTLSEAADAIALAQKTGWQAIVSHRSGETEDAFIADLAVSVNAGFIKTGAPCRAERTAKYNELLRIEEELGESAIYTCEHRNSKRM